MLKKIWTHKKRISGVILGLFLLHFLTVSIYGLVQEAKTADVIVILGNQVMPDGTPSVRLQERLDKGLELYQAGKGKYVLVSGGLGKEGFDEAKVMANYLAGKGIPRERLIEDPQGNTTFLTAQNSKRLMNQRQIYSAIVVSQYYHLMRCELAFRKMGIKDVSSEAAVFHPTWRTPYSTLREVAALYWYAFRKYD
ncbi:MAG: YdcF family protein [Bacteroidota bacterium]